MVNVSILDWLPETRKHTAVCGVPLKKFFSMPRMELTAAVLSVRVAGQIETVLSLNIDREIFWTDSQVALGYIRNETKKFTFFLENRVHFIQDNTKKINVSILQRSRIQMI